MQYTEATTIAMVLMTRRKLTLTRYGHNIKNGQQYYYYSAAILRLCLSVVVNWCGFDNIILLALSIYTKTDTVNSLSCIGWTTLSHNNNAVVQFMSILQFNPIALWTQYLWTIRMVWGNKDLD